MNYTTKQYAGSSTISNKKYLLEAIKHGAMFILKDADELLRRDRYVVLAAVRKHYNTLQYVDESFKRDKEVVLAAVQQNGYALEIVDESLKRESQPKFKEYIKEYIKILCSMYYNLSKKNKIITQENKNKIKEEIKLLINKIINKIYPNNTLNSITLMEPEIKDCIIQLDPTFIQNIVYKKFY